MEPSKSEGLPSPRLRLNHVYASAPPPHPLPIVHCKISNEVFNYFFRHLFAGEKGPAQAIVSKFFEKLYAECQRLGIPQVYDPDADQIIAKLLSQLNFNERPEPAPVSPRPSSGRRSNRSTPVGGPKPTTGKSQRQRTVGPSAKAPDA